MGKLMMCCLTELSWVTVLTSNKRVMLMLKIFTNSLSIGLINVVIVNQN